jgi:uncharacterized protein (DUF2141 family)
MKSFYLSALTLTLFSFSASAHELSINVENVKSTKGFLYIALHNSDSTWMKDSPGVQAQKLSMTEKTVKVIFKDLPSGEYGVTLYQDENDNGHIDKNAIGIPTEPYGFSNNGGSFGPPSFNSSKVTVNENKEITIYLQ